MNIWIFQTGEPLHSDEGCPRPMRAMNLANMLVKRGHNVVLWSSAFYHQEKRHRSQAIESIAINENLVIRLIPSPGYQRNISFSRLYDHLKLALNLKKELKAQTTLPDVAFVGYPPIETAFILARWLKKKKVPFLLDVKDQWPSILVDSVPKIVKPIVRTLLSPYYIVAKRAMRYANGLCAMSEGFINWSLHFAGRQRNHLDFIAPLTSPPSLLTDKEVTDATQWWHDKEIKSDSKCRIMFVGSFSRAFDFDAVFIAANELLIQGVDCEFVLCGDGELGESLKTRVKDCPNVRIVEWIDRPKIVALARISSAMLAPYKNSSDFVASLPNKVIDALLLELPLLSPLDGEVGGLIDKADLGLRYGINNGQSLSQCVATLADNPELAQHLSKNAKRTFEKHFSFDHVYGGLVGLLEEMARH